MGKVIRNRFAPGASKRLDVPNFDQSAGLKIPGGGNGGDMEARVAKLEEAVEFIQENTNDIKTDIRRIDDKEGMHFWRLGSGIAGLAILGIGLAFGVYQFSRSDLQRMEDRLSEQITALSNQISKIVSP